VNNPSDFVKTGNSSDDHPHSVRFFLRLGAFFASAPRIIEQTGLCRANRRFAEVCADQVGGKGGTDAARRQRTKAGRKPETGR
jgi:hypothetical protein